MGGIELCAGCGKECSENDFYWRRALSGVKRRVSPLCRSCYKRQVRQWQSAHGMKLKDMRRRFRESLQSDRPVSKISPSRRVFLRHTRRHIHKAPVQIEV